MKNIIFDLGGVVLKDEPNSILNDLEIDKETYNELNKYFTNWEDLDLGKDTLKNIYYNCNFPKEYDELYKGTLTEYYKYRKIDIRLIELINKLKENNYNIYILSDNNKECFEYYKNNELFKNIDGWVLSCEYHTIKKDGLLFEILLDKYNLKREECYFIDNSIINIKVSKEHGIKGYLFNAEEDINNLINDMKNNHINI